MQAAKNTQPLGAHGHGHDAWPVFALSAMFKVPGQASREARCQVRVVCDDNNQLVLPMTSGCISEKEETPDFDCT